jgi:hypothetical protein
MKYNVLMKKARILLALGTWVAILPYLGFPDSWKDTLFTLTGLGLMCFSYVLYREYKKKEKKAEILDNFRENSDFNENEDVGKIS